MTLHCENHCPKDCHAHKQGKNYHPCHCNKMCHMTMEELYAHLEALNNLDFLESLDRPDNPRFCTPEKVHEEELFGSMLQELVSDVLHIGVICHGCGDEPVHGLLWHRQGYHYDYCDECYNTPDCVIEPEEYTGFFYSCGYTEEGEFGQLNVITGQIEPFINEKIPEHPR